MQELLSHPSQVYDLFQILGLATFCMILWISLRKFISSLPLLILILSSSALIKPLAQAFSQFAGQPEGQSYYGALFAQIVSVALFLFFLKASASVKAKVWAAFAMASGALYALLRVGCFFRGCCWGRLCAFPWAHYYRNPEVVTPWVHLPLHPVQLYSALHGVLIVLILALYLKKTSRAQAELRPLRAMGIFLVLMGSGRLVTDMFRADIAFYKLEWFGFSPNTAFSLMVLMFGLLFYFKKPEAPTL